MDIGYRLRIFQPSRTDIVFFICINMSVNTSAITRLFPLFLWDAVRDHVKYIVNFIKVIDWKQPKFSNKVFSDPNINLQWQCWSRWCLMNCVGSVHDYYGWMRFNLLDLVSSRFTAQNAVRTGATLHNFNCEVWPQLTTKCPIYQKVLFTIIEMSYVTFSHT